MVFIEFLLIFRDSITVSRFEKEKVAEGNLIKIVTFVPYYYVAEGIIPNLNLSPKGI